MDSLYFIVIPITRTWRYFFCTYKTHNNPFFFLLFRLFLLFLKYLILFILQVTALISSFTLNLYFLSKSKKSKARENNSVKPCTDTDRTGFHFVGAFGVAPVGIMLADACSPCVSSSHSHKSKTPGLCSSASLYGEGGIRTHGTFRYTGFRDRHIQPLCHLSMDFITTLKIISYNKK